MQDLSARQGVIHQYILHYSPILNSYQYRILCMQRFPDLENPPNLILPAHCVKVQSTQANP
jgi:hypothetical protein